MTNPVLNNNIATKSVILWQYDKAYNLIRLINEWNEYAKASCTDFWNYFGNNIFPVDRADTFGLNTWGNILGIPRPTIHIPKYIDDDPDSMYDGNVNILTSPEWTEIPSTDTEAIEAATAKGFVISEEKDGTTVLYKLVEGFNIYGYSQDGYCVLDDGIVYDDDGQRVSDSGWKTVTIQNTLYRGLLKARFFMMCHVPTVANYNKYLAILFGAFDSENEGKIEYDIFDGYGNVKPLSDNDSSDSSEDSDSSALTTRYISRNIALDYQDMTMGFTFPENASVEEAYLIFQHYDVVYPFPAGIRYPGEFINDELVIGFNNTQSDGQMYKAFVDGLVMADDTSGKYPNGGIFSTTNRANYLVPPTVQGKAFIVRVTDNDSDSDSSPSDDEKYAISFTLKNEFKAKRQAVWIDWGNGDCGYRYIVPNDDGKKTFSSAYDKAGLYSVFVLFDSTKIDAVEPPLEVVDEYDLSVAQGLRT